MLKQKYEKWLKEKNFSSASNYTSRIETLERYYGDIDIYYEKDGCKSLLLEFEYTTDDVRLRKEPLHKIPIDTKGQDIYYSYAEGTRDYRSRIRKYVQFRNEIATNSNQTKPPIKNDKDKILGICFEYGKKCAFENLPVSDAVKQAIRDIGTNESTITHHISKARKMLLGIKFNTEDKYATKFFLFKIFEEYKEKGLLIAFQSVKLHLQHLNKPQAEIQEYIEHCKTVFNVEINADNALTNETVKIRYWFVPCDEWYDIETAFNDLPKVEWWQTQFLMGMKKGDVVYIYKTLPIGEIRYKGKITDTRIPFNNLKIDDSKYGKKVSGREYTDKDLFFEFEFDKALPKNQITKDMLKSWGLPYFQSRELPEEVAQRIAEVYLIDSDNNDLISTVSKPSAPEGKKKEYYTTTYERNPKNRQDCILIQGTICKVCDFDFYATYGDLGKDFIEVHHKKPLYSLEEEIIIDPAEDLAPVCSNCHRMLHRNKNKILTVEELADLMRKNN